jgi:hypothetical protein
MQPQSRFPNKNNQNDNQLENGFKLCGIEASFKFILKQPLKQKSHIYFEATYGYYGTNSNWNLMVCGSDT